MSLAPQKKHILSILRLFFCSFSSVPGRLGLTLGCFRVLMSSIYSPNVSPSRPELDEKQQKQNRKIRYIIDILSIIFDFFFTFFSVFLFSAGPVGADTWWFPSTHEQYIPTKNQPQPARIGRETAKTNSKNMLYIIDILSIFFDFFFCSFSSVPDRLG